jgi:hypothetical protein
MTLMSGKVYSDAGTPSNAIGENGDIFMQLDGLKTTYRKEGGAWTPIGNQLGTIPEFLKGVGVPSNVLGEDGQYYREVNTEAIYQKDAGAWTNIGSWTALETQQLLQSNGIGADLATTNHVSNIDTFIEAGAEGYFDNTTTGTKPHTYGVVKVTKAGTELHQSSQTSTNKVATRVSGDTGTTWSAWRIAANEDGDASRTFKAAAGVAADDVAVVGQIGAVPAGAGIWWPTSTAPVGFLEANGQSTAGYPNLVTIYGSNLPDMRGEFVRGWDNGRGIDSGRAILTDQEATEIATTVNQGAFLDYTNADALRAGGSQTRGGIDGYSNYKNYISMRPTNIAWMFIIKT